MKILVEIDEFLKTLDVRLAPETAKIEREYLKSKFTLFAPTSENKKDCATLDKFISNLRMLNLINHRLKVLNRRWDEYSLPEEFAFALKDVQKAFLCLKIGLISNYSNFEELINYCAQSVRSFSNAKIYKENGQSTAITAPSALGVYTRAKELMEKIKEEIINLKREEEKEKYLTFPQTLIGPC